VFRFPSSNSHEPRGTCRKLFIHSGDSRSNQEILIDSVIDGGKMVGKRLNRFGMRRSWSENSRGQIPIEQWKRPVGD